MCRSYGPLRHLQGLEFLFPGRQHNWLESPNRICQLGDGHEAAQTTTLAQLRYYRRWGFLRASLNRRQAWIEDPKMPLADGPSDEHSRAPFCLRWPSFATECLKHCTNSTRSFVSTSTLHQLRLCHISHLKGNNESALVDFLRSSARFLIFLHLYKLFETEKWKIFAQNPPHAVPLIVRFLFALWTMMTSWEYLN